MPHLRSRTPVFGLTTPVFGCTLLPMNSIHGNRELSDRRQPVAEQLAYYQHCLRLAEAGFTTMRSAEFYRRQILYFTQEGSR
jgi:hypothetical protein